MIPFGEIHSEQDIAQLIEQVAAQVSGMRSSDAVTVQEAQRVEDLLTRLQLVLNDLERNEVQQRGISRTMVDRFIALESRIRAIRGELYERPPQGGEPAQRNRRP